MVSATWFLDHSDRCRDKNGNMQTSKYIRGLFENVVIDPVGLKLDDFNGHVLSMRKLLDEIEGFVTGKDPDDEEEIAEAEEAGGERPTTSGGTEGE